MRDTHARRRRRRSGFVRLVGSVRWRWSVFFGAAVASLALGLGGAAPALAIDLFKLPDELRVHPVTPELGVRRLPPTIVVAADGLTSPERPDYGSTATIGSPIREVLNADANAAGAEIQSKAQELEPDSTDGQDALKQCMQGALWDILFDAGWDAANNVSFDLSSEIQTTVDRAAACVAKRFGIGFVAAKSISDWMMESVIDHGIDVFTRDPNVAAFVNWAAVTAWYSI